ncbi:hypothetical protein EDB80DRAFT_889111 [Ilyonectria destructans]|nr:hypothetical protein EDB80DRAFT_889111 [Ilyonectria destructans]
MMEHIGRVVYAKGDVKEGSLLNAWFLATESPVIISTPIFRASNGTLAAQVSNAGGLDGQSEESWTTAGAGRVVMGTRFILVAECTAPDFQKKAITEAVDGGVATSK